LIILPVSFIYVSVWTPQLSLTIRLIIKPFPLILGHIFPNLNAIGTLPPFFINIARIKCILHNFNVLSILKIKLCDHFLELFYLILTSGIKLLEITCIGYVEVLLDLKRWNNNLVLIIATFRGEITSMFTLFSSLVLIAIRVFCKRSS
jgi:hypothetical protein